MDINWKFINLLIDHIEVGILVPRPEEVEQLPDGAFLLYIVMYCVRYKSENISSPILHLQLFVLNKMKKEKAIYLRKINCSRFI